MWSNIWCKLTDTVVFLRFQGNSISLGTLKTKVRKRNREICHDLDDNWYSIFWKDNILELNQLNASLAEADKNVKIVFEVTSNSQFISDNFSKNSEDQAVIMCQGYLKRRVESEGFHGMYRQRIRNNKHMSSRIKKIARVL